MRLLMATALLALISAIPVDAQEDASQAVTWSWRLATPDARPGEEAELILEARIASQWVVYSSDFEAALGPRPTRLKAKRDSLLQLIEPLRSVGAHRKRDEELKVEYGYFAERAELRQRLRLPADGSPLELTLNGQACYEANGTCHLIRQDVHVAWQPNRAAQR